MSAVDRLLQRCSVASASWAVAIVAVVWPAWATALVLSAEPAAQSASAEVAKGLRVTKQPYGKMPDGTPVELYTLTNSHDLKAEVINYGAMLIGLHAPDRHGKLANITLHLDNLEQYLAGHPLFGCIVGRYANRIANAQFVIDGKQYLLAANSGRNHIHGGRVGFHRYVWKAETVQQADRVGVRLSHVSPDGDEGYPGKLEVTKTYWLTENNQLQMEYTAVTDKPTHVNLTNHAYWNLAGAGSGDVLGHELMINADYYLPVDAGKIPQGKPAPVKDTPMDFTKPHKIGARIAQVPGGYDHCYVLNKKPGEQLTLCARVVEASSGRVMEVWTTEPGVQLYTAGGMRIKRPDGQLRYGNHGGLCLEAQHFPDSPNRPDFPSTLLRPGQKYYQLTVHKFSVK